MYGLLDAEGDDLLDWVASDDVTVAASAPHPGLPPECWNTAPLPDAETLRVITFSLCGETTHRRGG